MEKYCKFKFSEKKKKLLQRIIRKMLISSKYCKFCQLMEKNVNLSKDHGKMQHLLHNHEKMLHSTKD